MQLSTALSGLSSQNFSLKKFFYFFQKNLLWKSFLYFLKKSFSNFQETELTYTPGKVYSENCHIRTRRIFRTLVYSEHCQTSTMERFVKIARKYKKKFQCFLIFREMKLSSSNIKKFLIFSQKKAFLLFKETETRKKFVIFREMKLSYITGNGNPKKHLIFQEVTFWARKVKNTHSEKTSYISGNGTL